MEHWEKVNIEKHMWSDQPQETAHFRRLSEKLSILLLPTLTTTTNRNIHRLTEVQKKS